MKHLSRETLENRDVYRQDFLWHQTRGVLKPQNDFFLFLHQTLWCDHSLESSQRDDSNECNAISFGVEVKELGRKM